MADSLEEEPGSGTAGEPPGPVDPRDPAGLTSIHVRRARAGDPASLEWLARRLTPLLLASARYQLRGSLSAVCEPEDLVQEVWLVALPKLSGLPERGGRYTPILLGFLSGILVNKVGNLLQRNALRKAGGRIAGGPVGGAGSDAEERPLDPADPMTGILTRLVRDERRDAVTEALEELEPRDREILVLRGIEQHSYAAIGAIAGADPAILPMRYRRALERLRKRLPGSVYEELVDA